MLPKEFQEILDTRFRPQVEEGKSKLCGLEEAISKQVKPGMLLHFPFNQVRAPSAAIHELVRQFWGKKPGFDVVTLAFNYPLALLVHAGMVRNAITGVCADPFYYPAPSKVYQRAHDSGTTKIVNGSLLTLTLRLKAGATGLPFLPSRSLVGSSIYEEDKENIKIIDDPFGSGLKLSLVKAIRPDLAMVHTLAADTAGNAIVPPPYGDNFYGALGSKNGILLTTEKIVSTEFIRKYSHFVKIPGFMVRSVSEVPFGAHPGGVYNPGIAGLPGYSEDYDFFAQAHEAAQDAEAFDKWIQEWVLSWKDHDEYVQKIGEKKFRYLKDKAVGTAWIEELEGLSDKLDSSQNYNSIEIMLCIAARKLAERTKAAGYKTILAGGGMSYLVAALATYALRDEKYDVESMVETGLFGVLGRPAEPHLLTHLALPACKMLTEIDTIMGTFVCGSNGKCIASLAAAEVDKHGNINTTRVGNTIITGSGGSNDICSAAQEAIVTIRQGHARLPEKVSYLTSLGDRVKTMVTNLGVFEKLGQDPEFTLTGYFPNPKCSSKEEIIHNIKEQCGWELKVSTEVKEIATPTAIELRTLRLLDAYRFNLGK